MIAKQGGINGNNTMKVYMYVSDYEATQFPSGHFSLMVYFVTINKEGQNTPSPDSRLSKQAPSKKLRVIPASYFRGLFYLLRA